MSEHLTSEPNISCRQCRHRHPASRTCKEAKRLAELGREAVAAVETTGGWAQHEAIELCRAVEAVCPPFGCHVALTGGLLYKWVADRDGYERCKDADILFYRIRQVDEINYDGLWEALAKIGLLPVDDHGWVVKSQYHGKPVDCFFPEFDGVYGEPHNVASFGEDDMVPVETAVEIDDTCPSFY